MYMSASREKSIIEMMQIALFLLLAFNFAIGLENNGYNYLEITANPGKVHPILTRTLQLRCSVKKNKLHNKTTASTLINAVTTISQPVHLNDTLDQSDQFAIKTSISQVDAEFSRLLSLVIGKRNKQTGVNETIASVTGCDSPVIESKYVGTVQVEGNTDGSPKEREQGFITLTWKSPLEEHSGEFHCEASALNSEKHSVTLVGSLEIQAVEPKISDLVNNISTNDKHITDLKTKVSELLEENKNLKSQTNVLNTEIEKLNHRIDSIKIPNVEKGLSSCSQSIAKFRSSFLYPPWVLTSVYFLRPTSLSANGMIYEILIHQINRTHVEFNCEVSGNYQSLSFQYIAIGI